MRLFGLKFPAILVCCVLWVVLLAHGALAAHGSAAVEKKTGILLVAFGTSVPEAQGALDNIDRKVRAAFPRRGRALGLHL